MRKKSKRILAAALSAILIWNTCEWQPQALAASSLQRIGAETEADDTAETAEKEATLKKSALKASPSNAEAKDNRGESGTNKAEAESGANKAESGADANTGKAEAGADAGADKAEAGANEAPNGTATGAEIKTEIEAFLELDEAIAVQKFSLGAKESDIILPDTLDVEVEGADEMLAEDSQNVHLVEAANKGTEKDTEAETAVWQISGITWKLNEEQSDLPEFHGGISEKDYFEEFDENGEPVETSTKTWAGYAEANQEYNGRVYVYTPILPEDLGKFEVADTADLPEIDVMVGDAGVALLADGPYDLNENYLVIDGNNVDQFDGKTITGNYCPTNRPESTYTDIKGGITIDNVTVNLTIKDVTIKSDGASGWDLAGIYLKGNARLNLTLEGENTLLGLDHGAGIEVEKGATLVITEQSNGSLKAVGGAYGAAGIGGNAGSTDSEGTNYGTGTIIIKGGTISAEGGVYWVSGVMDYQGGAGIGTGLYGIGGTIEILGGTISAEGGKLTGAGIGGGDGGGVDTIVIGGTNGEAPDITVFSYKSAKGYLGAAIGSGWNGVNGLQLSCGDIRILSGSVEVTGGNIGYGVLKPLGGNSMKGGSITISEEVQLELPLESKIEPRGDCTYGKKTFQIAAYDNQLPDGTYPADISLYRENDTERTNPVYQTKAEMTVSGFMGTIPDITQWIGHSGNMQMVVELTPSGGGTVKTMEGRVALNKGTDETISVMLGQNAYQKTMDLTIHDGRLKNDKNYTLTVQIGKEASEGGTAPDVVSYSSQKASGYQLKKDKVSWYTPLSGEVPVSVLVQEEGGEGENTNSFTVTGTLTMKPEEETKLSLTIGEPLYPVRFHFYSSKVQAAAKVSLTAGRLAGAASEDPMELNQNKGQFAFDGKLTIDAAAGNHAYALAYLPAGNYRFVINTGITELGSSDGRFTLDNETVKAAAAGTDIIVLNAAEALEGELDLSLGNISFSEENGKLTILYSKRDASGQAVTATLIDQSYDKCYRITSSGNNVEKYHLSVDTPASGELKLVLKSLTITPAEAIAPIQINGKSHVTTYLEGENSISINQSGKSSPAGISVAKDAKLTIDKEPGQPGSIEVLNNTKVSKTGAAIGGNVGQDAGTIHIQGGTVIAKMTYEDPRGAAIGASVGKSVKEIRISGGVVTAKGSWGAGIGTGGANSLERTGKIVIEGGTVNASSWKGAGIGSGIGYARSKPAITADIEIHGGMITAYSKYGACIGSGSGSSSKVLIDGGTICLDNKDPGYRQNVAHIGKGDDNSTYVPTDVKINGGTICLIGANGYIKRPVIYGWEKVGETWQKNTAKGGNGKPVYYTTADLTGIYENNTLVEKAGIEGSSYGFKDVRTDASGKLYMYLPASEAVKASFGGVEFTGKVEAGKDENVLEREQTSIDYRREVLKNMALYELEYAESKSAASWEKIPKGGEASLTEILDKQPESATEITLYVRKAATGSAAGEATEITIPARPAKPDQIQETDITKDSYSIKVKRPVDSRYEYGIAKSESGEPKWQSERTFRSPKPANTYYVTLRVKATDSSFASKPAERLSVTTPDTLLIDGPAGKVSFETKGTYGQTLDQILVKLAEGFQVVNYSRSPVSGTWKFSANQSGMSASSIYPEVKGTTAYQVEFIPTKISEGQYGETLTQSVIPEISPKELHAVLTTPIEKNYDGRTDIALKATVEIGASGQIYTISGLKGSFEDANAGTGKAVTIDPSEAVIETEGSAVNLQNYRVVYPAQTTGTIRPIQGSVSIDPQAWTGEKTYGDASFSLTGVKKVGDGALTYTSSDEKVLTVDAQGQVSIKGTGSAEVSITMADGTNYLGTSTAAKETITIEKGTFILTLTAVNRSTGVQQPEGILGTYEDDFDIIASIQGAYDDKLQGMIHFYDNGNQNPDTISVGEAGTAVLNLPKPGVASVGTHRMTAEFDFDTHQEWAAKYNTPAPAAFTFTIGKVAAPQITWPTAASVKAGSPLSDSALSGGSTEYGSFAWKNPAQTAQAGTHSYEVVFTPNEWASARYEIAVMTGTAEVTAPEDKPGKTEKPGETEKPEKPNRNSSSSGQNKTSGSGVIRQDSVKGTIDSTAGIITGETNSFANDGKSHWMLDEHGWWLRFADNTYPKGSVRESGGISHSWEHINGNWWAFDQTGYAKTGWLRDEDYGGWFYMDLEHGMQTGWVLLNGAWYYFNPVSDGKRGMMYAGQRTPDGYYVEKNGVWDGRNKQ
ncbi:YDG domain-containing protein [Candidatus Ventrimonas sp.]|uniref:YDG domain-containing protein n=1 Tax=Candidatus Ventrimonas sp. TaxID=3048889 RepID=UPI003AB8676E